MLAIVVVVLVGFGLAAAVLVAVVLAVTRSRRSEGGDGRWQQRPELRDAGDRRTPGTRGGSRPPGD